MNTVKLYNNDGTLSTQAQLLLSPKPSDMSMGEWRKQLKAFRSMLSAEEVQEFERLKKSLLNKSYRQTNKELVNASTRAYRKVHEKEFKDYQKAYNKAYRQANKERLNACRKADYEANKEYYNNYNKSYYEANKEIFLVQQKSYYEKNKEKLNVPRKAYREANKETARSYQKAYYEKNKEKLLKQQRAYREANKEKERLRKKAYRRANPDKVNTPQSKLRNAVRAAFKRIGKNKPTNTLELLGCTWEEAKAHIESLFTEGMTWDNHGVYGWHIDHIRPVSSFGEDELHLMNRIENLQPLWWQDNLSKSDKY